MMIEAERDVLSKFLRDLQQTRLASQDEQATLSDANCFIAVPEGETDLSAGAQVTVVVLERRYL